MTRPVLVRRVAQHPEDLCARADVDALGRLVQQEQLRLGLQPLREQRLLLVAAAERCRRQRSGRAAGRRTRCSSSRGLGGHRAAAEAHGSGEVAQHLEHHVVARPGARHAAVALAVRGEQREPCAIAPVGRHRRQIERGAARTSACPTAPARAPKSRYGHLVEARPDQAGDAERSRRAWTSKRDVAQLAAGQARDRDVDLGARTARGAASARLSSRRPMIISTSCASVVVRGDDGAAQAAVAQDGDAVGDLADLVEVVGDEQDAGVAARDDLAHDREQLLDALPRQEHRRLVEDQQAAARRVPAAPRGCSSTARTIASSARSVGREVVDDRARVERRRRSGRTVSRARARSAPPRDASAPRLATARPTRRFSSTVSSG